MHLIDAHSRRLLFENKLSEEEWHHLDACSHDAKKLITDMQSDPDYASLGLADILRVMTAMKHVKRSADVLLADAKPCFHNPIPARASFSADLAPLQLEILAQKN